MCSGLEEVLGVKLPALDDPGADDFLRELMKKHEVDLTPPHTTARMLDALVGEFLEGTRRTMFCFHVEARRTSLTASLCFEFSPFVATTAWIVLCYTHQENASTQPSSATTLRSCHP